MDLMQIEPSNQCMLRCQVCWVTYHRRQGTSNPRFLEEERMCRLLSDFSRRGVDIRWIDFQGHGEPLTHPGIWSLVRHAKDIYPSAVVSMCTNGHGVSSPEVFESGIDQVECAIDGVDQESLVKYRAGASFEKAFGFMKDLAGASSANGSKIRMVWRYVLFEHNDSPEQLREAWKLASEARVGELRFIFTHTGPSSRSIRNTDDLCSALETAGIPSARVRLRTQRSLGFRNDVVQALRGNGMIYPIARRFWRASMRRRSNRDPGSMPVVTCDYHAPSPVNLRRALKLGTRLAGGGRLEDARLILEYVDYMLARPGLFDGGHRILSGAEAFGPLYDALAARVGVHRGSTSP
jgi:hypothetical protein